MASWWQVSPWPSRWVPCEARSSEAPPDLQTSRQQSQGFGVRPRFGAESGSRRGTPQHHPIRTQLDVPVRRMFQPVVMPTQDSEVGSRRLAPRPRDRVVEIGAGSLRGRRPRASGKPAYPVASSNGAIQPSRRSIRLLRDVDQVARRRVSEKAPEDVLMGNASCAIFVCSRTASTDQDREHQ